ncbi:MAG: hypothetical protein D6693_08290 [Planctomycetota bacterium]|nr:MAG: hypothetical protein D6693_08290 [Planctomycetota bacterium]
MARDTDATLDWSRDPAPSVWAPRLRRILDAQAALYETLDRLSASQRALIDSEDTEGLLRLLADRQETLARLERSNEHLAPFRERWADLMGRLDEADRRGFEARIDGLAERIAGIARRDEQDQEALSQRRGAATAQIAQIARTRGALSAYGGRRGGATYQDREG